MILTECKCLRQYCLKCRYPEDHQCSFDYSEDWKDQLKRNNPVIAGEKISKI